MSEPTERHRRTVRSFVLREGRLTPGQQRAFDELWPRYGLDYQEQVIDLAALFGNSNPVFVEIGFGNGESLAEMARQNPQHNFIGIEVHRPGVGHLLLKLEQYQCSNVRAVRHDAVEVIANMLPAASLQGVYLLFPDPWHKKRHHKRRILQASFIELLGRAIRPGGFFHAATDWDDYATQMMQSLGAADRLFENAAGRDAFTPRPAHRPLTKFESRGLRLGHRVSDLVFIRRT